MDFNDLINQYKKETGKSAYKSETSDGYTFDYIDTKFAKWMATQIKVLASRRTCGIEQRLFLDEIEKLRYSDKYNHAFDIEGNEDYGLIIQEDFEADLQKVVEGK